MCEIIRKFALVLIPVLFVFTVAAFIIYKLGMIDTNFSD